MIFQSVYFKVMMIFLFHAITHYVIAFALGLKAIIKTAGEFFAADFR